MFNQTNMFIGSVYATSLATGGLVALGVLKLTQNNYRIARKAARKATTLTDKYWQSIYRVRAQETLDLIYSSDASSELKDKIRDLLDCPL